MKHHPELVELSVAGLGVRLAVPDTRVADGLRQRYSLFPLCSPPAFEAEITLVEPFPASGAFNDGSPDPRLVFTAQGVQMVSPSFSGEIDIPSGQGQLRLASHYPVSEIDYYVRLVYALLVFQRGGLLFHAAGIQRGGMGYVFFGHSGSGKTTVARLSPPGSVLNDDLLALYPASQNSAVYSPCGWMVSSTPFWNPSQFVPNAGCVPLGGLFRLVQARQVAAEHMAPGRALAEVICSVPVIAQDPQRSLELIWRGRQLVQHAPAYRLYFLPDDSFWPVVEAQIKMKLP